MQITDGTVRRLGLVRSIVLFFGRPEANAPPSTDRFDRLDARFALANAILRANSFNLRSPDMDGAGTGTMNLDTRALNGRMNVTLSEALSRQAGTDLRRLHARGQPDRAAGGAGRHAERAERDHRRGRGALQRGLRNEAERQLKGILDRFK